MNRFEHVNAESIEEVFAHLNDRWDTRIIAGGTDLLHEMKSGIIRPGRLVNIKPIPNLGGVRESGPDLVIGALCTLDEMENNTSIREKFPALRLAVQEAASPRLRNMATAAGNICQRPRCWYYRHPEIPCLRKGGRRCYAVRGENAYHAIFGGGPCHIVCPSDLAQALVALDASLKIRNPEGERVLSLENFFVGPKQDPHRENKLKANELITEICIPLPKQGNRSIYLKARERRTWDFALAGVAVSLVTHGDTITNARIVFGGVAPNPWRSEDSEYAEDH